jgi:hypothetical protein
MATQEQVREAVLAAVDELGRVTVSEMTPNAIARLRVLGGEHRTGQLVLMAQDMLWVLVGEGLLARADDGRIERADASPIGQ